MDFLVDFCRLRHSATDTRERPLFQQVQILGVIQGLTPSASEQWIPVIAAQLS
jgi:hypothetical protein